MTNLAWKKLSCGLTASFALASAQLPSPAQAANYDINSIHIAQPWARATPKDASSGTAYMTGCKDPRGAGAEHECATSPGDSR
jgi:copper(I)-binding protein